MNKRGNILLEAVIAITIIMLLAPPIFEVITGISLLKFNSNLNKELSLKSESILCAVSNKIENNYSGRFFYDETEINWKVDIINEGKNIKKYTINFYDTNNKKIYESSMMELK